MGLAAALVLAAGGCPAEVGTWPGLDEPGERTAQAARLLPVPFLTQKPNEMACTAASLGMSLKYYGLTRLEDGKNSSITAQTVYDWFSAKGYLDPKTKFVDSNKVSEATEVLSGGSVRAEVTWWAESNPADVVGAIDAGRPTMLFTYHNKLPGSGITTQYGHNILVYGYSGDTFYYYNPYKTTKSAGSFTISGDNLMDALMAEVQISFAPVAAADCHSGQPWSWSYCSSACRCGVDEGDCDSDAECKPGLVCAPDVGARYGASSFLDVCQPSGSTPTPPPPAWSCGQSAHAGQQYWTCSGGSIYRCTSSGTPQVVVCPAGCKSNPVGTDDTCL